MATVNGAVNRRRLRKDTLRFLAARLYGRDAFDDRAMQTRLERMAEDFLDWYAVNHGAGAEHSRAPARPPRRKRKPA